MPLPQDIFRIVREQHPAQITVRAVKRQPRPTSAQITESVWGEKVRGIGRQHRRQRQKPLLESPA